jgi:hypothetical protein
VARDWPADYAPLLRRIPVQLRRRRQRALAQVRYRQLLAYRSRFCVVLYSPRGKALATSS